MRQETITKRLETELEQLAEEVRALDQFDESTTLDIHALSCLMRYAAWHDPAQFLEWLRSKRFTINPAIIDRIELYTNLETLDSGERDGIELRIHIFRNSNETFKHSHKQDFITLCLQGEYRYRYFEMMPPSGSAHQGASYEVYARKQGRQELIESRAGHIREVRYVNQQPREHSGGQRFHEESAPLFVDARYIHTVEHVSAEPVITFVVRRGLCRAETVVLRAPGDEDPRAQNDAPPKPATEAERERVCQDLLRALTEGGRARQLGARWSDIEAYQSPSHKTLTLPVQALNHEQEELLARVMVMNGIYSVPMLDSEGRCVELLSIPMVQEQDRDKDHQQRPLDRQPMPMVAYTHEPLLYAILAMIINESLMIPIVDDEGRYCGLLSVDDLLEARVSLGKAMFWALYESEHEDGVSHVRGLLSALEQLKSRCLISELKPSRREHDALVHEALVHLDELLLMAPGYDLGRDPCAQRSYELDDPISAAPLRELTLCPEPDSSEAQAWLTQSLRAQGPGAVVYTDGERSWRTQQGGSRHFEPLLSPNLSIRELLKRLRHADSLLIAPPSTGAPPLRCDLESLNSPQLSRQLLAELMERPLSDKDQTLRSALVKTQLTEGALSLEQLRALLKLWWLGEGGDVSS